MPCFRVTALALGFFLTCVWPVHAAQPDSELECAFGEALLSTGDPAAAIEHLDRALELDPANERARLIKARAHVAAGEPDAGLEQIEILLEAHPGDPALLREQGYILLLTDDPMWAIESLKEALAADPGDGLAHLYLGYAAILLEVPGDAVEPLEKAAAQGPEPATAHYLEAVALSRTGELDRAYDAVQTALDMGLVSDPWSRAAADLGTALKRELVPFRLFDLSLQTGLFWDSNVPLFTQDIAELMQDSGVEHSAFGLTLSGSAMLRPLRGRHWALGGGGSVFQSFNFSRDVDDFNTTVYGATLELVRTWDEPLPLRSFRVRYLQSLVCLWGGPLVDFDHYYRFTNSYGGDVTAEFVQGRWGATRLRMLWRYALFTDYGRDNMGFSAGLNQTFFLWERRLKLAVEVGIKVEHAKDLAWNQIGPRMFAGLSLLGPWELQFLAAFTYEREDHLHSGPDTRWGRHRVDDVLVYSAALSRTFLDQLTLGASFTYIDNRSTLRISYDYDRAVVSLYLAWRLQ